MSPEGNYDYWTQKFESGELNEVTYRMMIGPYLKYKAEIIFFRRSRAGSVRCLSC